MDSVGLLRQHSAARGCLARAARCSGAPASSRLPARRQVRAPQLAEDIAQSVFLDLARHAEELSSIQPLAAWLKGQWA